MFIKYILRADDICPTVNWDNFNHFIELCDRYDIRPLLAVIPDNKDKALVGDKAFDKKIFWKKIKKLQNADYDIGIHGCTHQYLTKNRGILFLNNYSEFAGVSPELQEGKIKKAIKIFKENKINTDIFIAPAHTFDWQTVEILKKYKIDKISDGIALFPYYKKGVLFMPVTLNGPKKALLGIRTICMHLNSFNKKKFDQLERFISANKKTIISFSQAVELSRAKKEIFNFLNRITFAFKGYYYLRYYLEATYSQLIK